MITLLIERLKHIGEIPLCNGIKSRAPHLWGICFPLCYRCSACLITFVLTLFVCYHKPPKKLFLYILCMIPMIIDGGLQVFFAIESTNIKRVITGALFGYGIGMLVLYLYQYIDEHFAS